MIFVLALATLLCLAVEPLRLFGVVGLLLFGYIFPLQVLALLAIAGCVYFIFHKRSTTHEQPKPPAERD